MRILFIALAALLPCLVAGAESAREDALRALARAAAYLDSASVHGGYPGIWSADLKETFGESHHETAGPGRIWVQPPGTPTVGHSLLAAYTATGDAHYLAMARAAGRALAWGQSDNGGWGHVVDVSALTDDAAAPTPVRGKTFFDDNISQGALTFLIALDGHLDEAWLTDAIDRGIGVHRKAQFDSGGWPQTWPPGEKRTYSDLPTFNDRAMNDCIRVMFLAYETYGREDCRAVARRGADFILRSQLPAPQAGWAQQYNLDLTPAWARTFEPPGVCSLVTVRNIHTLLDLYLDTGDKKYLAAIPPALEWFGRSRLPNGKWARLYEMKTNRPIYGDRDRKVHYTLAEISEERRSGYSWEAEYGVNAAKARYEKVAGQTLEEARADAKKKAAPDMAKLESDAARLVRTQHATGCWMRKNDFLTSGDFAKNLATLARYLDLTK